MAPSSPDRPVLPLRAVGAPGESPKVEVTAAGPWTLRVWHHGELVASQPGVGPCVVDLGPLTSGGYAVEITGETNGWTAMEVPDPDCPVFRYGFVASYPSDKDVEGVVRFARRLHLTGVQFYDWGYRHADLVGGGDSYADALGQQISLATVRDLASGLSAVGCRPLGYAAVYGVGDDEWHHWEHAALTRADGSVWSLAGFLRIINPADAGWLDHFMSDLRAATALGFAGFHLDQYGAPRLALDPSGTVVDLAQSFVKVIEQVRAELPDSTLCFNNVNDFGTQETTQPPQDVTYIEVWDPNTQLEHLNRLVWHAHGLAPERPIVLAAYQSVYASASIEQADAATRLTMAAIFAAGGTQLLAGEEGRVLTDPYYVRNAPASQSTMEMLQAWYDFATAQAGILHLAGRRDATASWFGALNDEIVVEGTSAPITTLAEPGSIWARVVRLSRRRFVLHLVNLIGQGDTLWDGPKSSGQSAVGLRLRLRGVQGVPDVRWGDPDVSPNLTVVSPTADEDGWSFQLPELNAWLVLLIDL